MRMISVRPGAAGVYLFMMYILYLTGVYFGSIYYVLFLTTVFLSIFSLVSITMTGFSLRYNQEFSTDHPLKGEDIVYTFSATKESGFPSTPVRAVFRNVRQGMDVTIPDVRFYPTPNRRFEFNYSIHCPYRGVYTMGLDALELIGIFNLLSFRIPAWTRTFYVYPRIITIGHAPFTEYGGALSQPGTARGREEDYTLLESLVQYRAGLPIRHIAWKKFASLGEPVLKAYNASSRPGITIYLDTRRRGPESDAALAAEDCSVEILVALVKYYTEQNIPVSVYGDGWDRFIFPGRDDAMFHEFHRSTIGVFFSSRLSPAEIFYADAGDSQFRASTVLFVTHHIDPEIMTLAELGSHDTACGAILNLSSRSASERLEIEATVEHLKERGALLHTVRNADAIKEDLER